MARTEDEVESAVLAVLNALGLPFRVVACEPAFADTAAFCERYGYAPDRSANTIIVAGKREPKAYAACVVRADRRLDVNHAVRALMGGLKLSFAQPDETVALTGMMIGGVTAFALPPGLPIFVDATIMDRPSVILGSGSRSAKVDITPEVFRRLPGARIIDGLSIVPIAATASGDSSAIPETTSRG